MVTKQVKTPIILLFLLFFTCSTYSQIDKPKSIFVTKFFTHKTLALVVLFDKGIDSINFPIDTTLIKISIKKLDSNGKTLSPKKVYYEYRFTAKVDTIYKLPSAKIWTNNKPYKILIDEYVELKKLQKTIKLSKLDSLKLVAKEEAERLKKYKVAVKERLEGKIDSRISKKINKQLILLWTDKNILKVNDNFRIVIESNKEFDMTDISTDYIKNLSEKFTLLRSSISSIYENGYENHYIIFICKALSVGKIIIKPLNIKTKGKNRKTNKWTFNIID